MMPHNAKLRRARLERQWTLAVASEKVGVDIGTFHSWELGKRRPHLSSLKLLCAAFQATAEDLGFAELEQETSSQGRGRERAKINVPPGQIILFDETEEGSHEEELLYDTLEVDVIAEVLNWHSRSEGYDVLQKKVLERIKKYDTMTQQQDNEEAKISRRHALLAIAKFPISMFGLTVLGSNQSLVAEEVLPLCAAGLTVCGELRDQGDLASVKYILSRYIPTLVAIAQQSSRQQQAAAHLATQCYLLASAVAEHFGSLELMESCCKEALKYTQLAGNRNLEIAALTRLAVKYDFENRPRKALETYEQAIPYLEEVTPLIRGRVYAGLAGKAAHCGKKQDADRYLGLAYENYPENPENDLSFHYVHTDHKDRYQLLLWTGITRKHLGQFDLAWDTFTQVGELQPRPGLLERMRVEFLTYSAEAAIGLRDLDRGVLYLETAGRDALALGNVQRYVEACDTYRVMQVVWPHETAVASMQDLFNRR